MTILELPKEYSPDFSNPRFAPNTDVEVDWSNPIAHALGAVLIPTAYGYIDILNDFTADSNADPVIYKGNRAVYRSSSDKIDAGTANRFDGSQREISGFLLLSSDANSGTLLSQRDGNPADFQLYLSSGSMFLRTESIQTALTGAIGNTSATVNSYAFTRTGTTAAGYVDGVTTGAVAHGGTPNGAGINLSVGNRWQNYPTVGFTLQGTFGIVYLWNRELSGLEHRELSANPYQLLKPKSPLQYFIPSAAGGTVVPIFMNHYRRNNR
jgi:hypothetical protein